MTNIRELMLADIARSGLDDKDAKLLHMSTAPHKLKPAIAGYTIPYFDTQGRKTKFYRVRYVESTNTGFAALAGKKTLRYAQPPGTVNEVYLPPYIDWKEYLAGKLPIIFTEGEKKSAAATKNDLPTIGLGGVWCFMSTRAQAPLLPIFDEINLKDRMVYICYDSDAATNPDIVVAEYTFAKRLTERGAVVMIARIPSVKGAKVGIDDYLLKYDAAKFRRNILNRSIEFDTSHELHHLNSEIVYLRKLGIIYDHVHEMRVSAASFVQHTHSNRFIDVVTYTKEGDAKMVRKSAAKMWLEWEHRAELQGMTYAPGQPSITDSGELNMWSGWGVQAATKGDVSPWKELLDVLFGDQHKSRLWFERWCAYPIQNPGCKMASAVLMWGASQGTGKTLCGHTLMNLYGDNATEVKDSDLEDASFTWAENKQFVLADDITGQNNRKLANKFKTMITQKTLHINQKYIPRYSVPDLINYYFTSNDPDAFYMDDKDRRNFVHEVLVDRLPDDLRRRYVAWMNSREGMEALFYYMLNMDLGDFDPQAAALHTEAKGDMTHISKSELGTWVAQLRDHPDSVIAGRMRGDLFTAEELHMLFDPTGTKRASPNALARELKRSGFSRIARSGGAGVRVNGRQLRLYVVRNADFWFKASLEKLAEHYSATRSAAIAKQKF